MNRSLRLTFVLLTTVAAVAAGLLNGRVLCMAGPNHIAVEEPHPGVKHSSRDHACDSNVNASQSGGEDRTTGDGGNTPDGGCTDLQAGGTPLREVPPAAYDHQHVQLALPLALPNNSSLPSTTCPRRREVRFAGTPPGLADLACLRSIILLV